jgi:hypothetical protein
MANAMLWLLMIFYSAELLPTIRIIEDSERIGEAM